MPGWHGVPTGFPAPCAFQWGGEPVAKPVQAWMWVPAVNTLIIIAEDPL